MGNPIEIVVTNDDGINAPGIRALVEAAKEIGNVTVIAPDKNWSASGHQKALGRPLRVEQVSFPGGIPAFSTDGGPSDCTALAGLGFLKKRIDLILTGINPTANVSRDITYSGTVTSALEATIWDMRGIAFSINASELKPDQIDFTIAKKVVVHTVKTFLNHELPPFTILNVNIPYVSNRQIQGYKITREGSRFYRDELVSCVDPFGRPYYWFGGLPPYGDEDEGTDCGEISRGFVSITPVHLDLTAYETMESIRNWEWEEKGEK
ncbi:MAG: 5'/3'-nucleotidase SurE [Flexilinea sp.]